MTSTDLLYLVSGAWLGAAAVLVAFSAGYLAHHHKQQRERAWLRSRENLASRERR